MASICKDYLMAVCTKGAADKAKAHCAPNAPLNAEGLPDAKTLQAYADAMQNFVAVLPDFHIDIKSAFESNGDVCVVYMGKATHTGADFGPVKATGKSATFTAVWYFKVADGKIASAIKGWDHAHTWAQFGWPVESERPKSGKKM